MRPGYEAVDHITDSYSLEYQIWTCLGCRLAVPCSHYEWCPSGGDSEVSTWWMGLSSAHCLVANTIIKQMLKSPKVSWSDVITCPDCPIPCDQVTFLSLLPKLWWTNMVAPTSSALATVSGRVGLGYLEKKRQLRGQQIYLYHLKVKETKMCHIQLHLSGEHLWSYMTGVPLRCLDTQFWESKALLSSHLQC